MRVVDESLVALAQFKNNAGIVHDLNKTITIYLLGNDERSSEAEGLLREFVISGAWRGRNERRA